MRLCDEREGDRAERGRAVKTVRTFERFARAGDEVCGGDGSAFDGRVIKTLELWVFAAARRRARLAATPSAERSETKRNEAKNYLKNLPKPLGASPSVNPPAPPSSYSIIFEHLARPDGSRAHASMARTAAEMLASSPRSLQ